MMFVIIMCCGSLGNPVTRTTYTEDGYVESKLDNQIIDIEVYNSDRFKRMPKDNLEYQWISTGIFLYWCSGCHVGNNLSDTTGIYMYEGSLEQFLLHDEPNHGNWVQEYNIDLDEFDVEAIQMYIDRKR